jgi:hypothetical protein
MLSDRTTFCQGLEAYLGMRRMATANLHALTDLFEFLIALYFSPMGNKN